MLTEELKFLTPRELEYCKMFVLCKGNPKDIATRMLIKLTTERLYRTRVLFKLDIPTKTELMFELCKNISQLANLTL